MTPPKPQLSVVVCTRGLESPDETLASVLPTGRGTRDRLELIHVAQGRALAGRGFDRVVDVYPAGSGYARNRGLALACAPSVAFLEAGAVVGPAWLDSALARSGDEVVVGPDGSAAFPRSLLTASGGFDLSLGPVEGTGFEADAVLRLSRDGAVVRSDPRLVVRRSSGLRDGFAAGSALGRVARRHRTLPFAARTAARAARRLARGGLRDGRDAVGTIAGVLAGAVRAPSGKAPPVTAGLVPAGLAPELERRTLTPLPLRHKGKTQFLYRAGDDALLHVYLDPGPRLLHSLEAREAIRTRSDARGIPRLFAAGEGLDSLWVLEELLPGREPDARAVATWLPRVAEWAVSLALPTGPPLREVDAWIDHRAELVADAPPSLRDGVEHAARVVDELPSVHMHGDLQRTNLLVSPAGVGAVDWEGAWLHGIPGLDLVYLSLLAGGGPPSAAHVREIETGVRLRPQLERVGVGPEALRPLLLVLLASWAASERRRLARLGKPPADPVFRPLLEDLGPELAREASSAVRRSKAR